MSQPLSMIKGSREGLFFVGWFRKKQDPVEAYKSDLDRQVAEAEAARQPEDFMATLISQGNKAIADGGWCAPSEVSYDFIKMESLWG